MLDVIKIVFGVLGALLALSIFVITLVTIIGGIKSARNLGDKQDEKK